MNIKWTGLVLLAAVAFSTPCAASLVTNGDFETGDFTGWTGGFPDNFVATGTPNSAYVHTGNNGVAFGAGYLSILSQSLTTVAGTSYDVSFWLNSNGQSPDQVSLAWGGTTIFNQTNIPANGWTEFSFVETASSIATLLAFGLEQDAGYSGLDDISVTAVSGVPEPSTWVMILLGFGGIGFIANRRNRRRLQLSNSVRANS